jgi:hypothetical protein
MGAAGDVTVADLGAGPDLTPTCHVSRDSATIGTTKTSTRVGLGHWRRRDGVACRPPRPRPESDIGRSNHVVACTPNAELACSHRNPSLTRTHQSSA